MDGGAFSNQCASKHVGSASVLERGAEVRRQPSTTNYQIVIVKGPISDESNRDPPARC